MADPGCDLVVVGASAGGVEALKDFARSLPGDFDIPILVVLHVPANGPSVLPEILSRAGKLPAAHGEDGQQLEGGRIYIAPPDHHMLVSGSRIVVNRGPRENGYRPAIDTLFRSAAKSFGERAAGVILSGTLDDGTVGLFQIKRSGGATLVQDPNEATYSSMPANAIRFMEPGYVQPISELVDTLVRLTAPGGMGPGLEDALDDAAPHPDAEIAQPGELAPFSCPDCGGTLWETDEGTMVHYRCRVGHAYSMNTLVVRHGDVVERAMWTAYRALEERSAMSHRLARRFADSHRPESSERFTRQANDSAEQAAELKTLLDRLEPTPDVAASPDANVAGQD